jgi:hypothetical protein
MRLTHATELPPPAGHALAGIEGVAREAKGALLTQQAWRILGTCGLGVAAIAAFWHWPVFAGAGWAEPLYQLHDSTYLPLKGWLWDRNLPHVAVVTFVIFAAGLATFAMGAVLAGFHERWLSRLLGTPGGHRLLTWWSTSLGLLGTTGARSFDGALAVADLRCEQTLARLSLEPDRKLAPDERAAIIDPIHLRRPFFKRDRRSLQEALYVALMCRMFPRLLNDAALQSTITSAFSGGQGVVRDPLAQEALEVLELMAQQGTQSEAGNRAKSVTGLVNATAARTADLRASPEAFVRLTHTQKLLSRRIAIALAHLSNDRDIALDWLEMEDAAAFSKDTGGFESGLDRNHGDTFPLIERATLELIVPWCSRPRMRAEYSIDFDADACWWDEPWHQRRGPATHASSAPVPIAPSAVGGDHGA